MSATTAGSQAKPFTVSAPSSGARLVATGGRVLPLLGTTVSVDARGGVAQVVLEQTFRNAWAEPLEVTYSLPLPADAAVSGFAFRVGGRRIVGEVDGRMKARARYEEALVEGRSAALLEQERSSLFTQAIGNIPPGAEVVAEVTLDQRLVWLEGTDEGVGAEAEGGAGRARGGAWAWRFPTVVAPRYLGEPGRVEDAGRVAQDVADGPLAARASLVCVIRDALPGGGKPASPSHAVEVSSRGLEGAVVTLREGARLDRDLVVEWPVATPEVGVSLDVGRPVEGRAAGDEAAYGLLTLVPPASEAAMRSVARDMIVLLDTSGSMGGEPLSQAVRVTSALVRSLRAEDRIELIEFSSQARRFQKEPVFATEEVKRSVIAWLEGLRASGSTEMTEAILSALHGLRAEVQRQVVLVTDGQIGFEAEVVAAILQRLPAGSRLHTVGVGSAVNRSLTGPAARAGRGIEVVIGLREDPEPAAQRVLRRTRAPLVVELSIGGSAVLGHAPARLPDLFAGAPALVGVSLRPEGGELLVQGRTATGGWEQRVKVPATVRGEGSSAAGALFGREAAEDLEMRLGGGAPREEIDAALEKVGIAFQIATRVTSWVAVSSEVMVDPGAPTRQERMPHELPFGVSAEGVGLRATSAGPGVLAEEAPRLGAMMPRRAVMAPSAPAPAPMAKGKMSMPGAPPPPPAQVGMRAEARASTGAQGAAPPALGGGGRVKEDAGFGGGKAEKARSSVRRPDEGAFASDDGSAFASRKRAVASAPPSLAEEAESFHRGGPSDLEDATGRFMDAPPMEPETAAPVLLAPEMKEDAAEMEDDAAEMEDDAPQRDLSERTLQGRVVLQKGDVLVLQATVEGSSLGWSPEGEVELFLDDGSRLVVRAVLTSSTRAGQIAPGQVVRLAVALEKPLGARLLRVSLRRGEETLHITL
ncbi:VIT domain-containing protein [Chondromyces crocatus]|nr:VIT domain-containing protein [Chondromyces crocatus]